MSDSADKPVDGDAKMTADDPMMKRAEMSVTGGDVRSLGEPVPPTPPSAESPTEPEPDDSA